VLTSSKTDTHGISVAIVPSGQYDAFRRVCERLAVLSKKEDDYLTQQGFTEENLWVKDVRSQIADAEKIRNQLQEKYPQLGSLDIPLLNLSREAADMSSDLHHSSAQVAGLKIKIDFLHSQLNQVWSEATNFERVAATLSELQQQKESAETSLKYFTDRLERSLIDSEMFEGKASNISIIQSPTPPLREWSKQFKKILGMFAAGGIMTGLGLAFVMELYLDRSVKRPADIENKLGLPLFISIPALRKNGSGKRALLTGGGRLLLNNASGKTDDGGTSADQSIAPWDRQHPLRRFYEGLRDRLIVYFEARNVVHNPKLVAVTSCGHGAGVSSIAAGLAATLSETDDGNVLLVNISGERGAAQQFYKGELDYSLDEALQSEKKGTLVKANLYSSVKQVNGDMLPANLPKKLSALMPQLKASQYDYIIFDMPPVTPTTTTARLSGLMDMVLLVVESEKTNQDVVTGVIKLLAESKATVSTVLNKSRSYIPAKLHQEFQSYV
jgi:succinoglycan biosynthesis transport protein ExoP